MIHRFAQRGVVLPVVLVLVAGLWLLCLSLLSLVVVSQRSHDVRGNRLQAELALHAGLEQLRGNLLKACKGEDFLVIQSATELPRQAPMLYALQPRVEAGEVWYQYQPLYSSQEQPMESRVLELPATALNPAKAARIRSHPWLEPVEVEWMPIHNAEGQTVARYAYWIEDLEAGIDPSQEAVAIEGPIRLQAMDESENHIRTRRLLDRRSMLLSPNSSLAVAGAQPPLRRWSRQQDPVLAGRLVDPWESFLEGHCHVGIQGYEELARVPFVRGLSPAVMGRQKRDLNHLLDLPAQVAVDQMAEWMRAGLPEFEQRAGGFPEDYLKTLAANAIDYADSDHEPTISPGRYRGVDGQPFLSEVVLHLHFRGLVQEGDRWVLKWTMRLFAELWNLSSQAIEDGVARLSYEVHLRPTAVGMGGPGLPFDSPEILNDANQSQHALERVGGRYFSPEVEVNLRPDEYRFHEFARVDYAIECSPQLDAAGRPLSEWFDLVEPEEEARGLSLIWNGREVERLQRLHRDPHGLANFRTDQRRKTAKACIPALNYGGYGSMVNNAGDPRISHYLRGLPLGENAYPENLSPHRRNIRRRNIYDQDPSPLKTRHYGRVMPSQWPDGGHDSATGDFRVTTSDARLPTDPEFWPLAAVPSPQQAQAPQRLSNAGAFQRVTELGRVFDPVMWTPAYPDLADAEGSGLHDTAELLGSLSFWQRPSMPVRRGKWPAVSWRSMPSSVHGGGNTLRIGRAEHPRFDQPGLRATHLLDLFHCGEQQVEGRINLNTASREVLRCLAYGALREDEAISRVRSLVHDTQHALGPQLEAWEASDAQLRRVADRVAEGIIRCRPFGSPSELAQIRDETGTPLFGNAELFESSEALQWSDAAAEELFGRMHATSGVRSRNFRVWMVGQCLQEAQGVMEVTAQAKRVMQVFVDPGERGPKGELMTENQQVRVLHVSEF